jgi:hypothetical protein
MLGSTRWHNSSWLEISVRLNGLAGIEPEVMGTVK